MNGEEVTHERAKTHGDFNENARVAQQLKATIDNAEGSQRLTAVQAEALDLICTKIGRILSGDPNFSDHWLDIRGYAKLAYDEIASKQLSKHICHT